MFNSSNGYSLADIAAATGGDNRNNGMWGDGSWWIIILFLFIFAGWNGNGNGVFGGGGSTGSGITDGYILTSDFANIERKIDGVNNGLCDGFYAMNTGMLNGFAGVNNAITQQTIAQMEGQRDIQSGITALGTQMAQCCCDQRYENATNFSNLNYRLAEQTAAITANQDANTRSILEFLTQDKIATLEAENQSLKFAASQQAQNNFLIHSLNPSPVPAYVVANPYAATQYGCCNCGC